MAFRGFKNLNRRTPADKLWRDKAFDIAKDRKYDWNQHGLKRLVEPLRFKIKMKIFVIKN